METSYNQNSKVWFVSTPNGVPALSEIHFGSIDDEGALEVVGWLNIIGRTKLQSYVQQRYVTAEMGFFTEKAEAISAIKKAIDFSKDGLAKELRELHAIEDLVAVLEVAA
jgi:hypothetical protein